MTGVPRFEISRIGMSAPFRWLKSGIDDFRQIPGLSLLYGAIFAALCFGVYALVQTVPWYTLGYITGLMVIGPFLASGLYVASRDLERSTHQPSVRGSLRLLGQRATYLGLFSVLLALVMAAWIRFSALLFAIHFSTLTPTANAYTSLLTSPDGWSVLALFFGIGFLLAVAVFVISAVAIPLILDRDADFITAVQTSYRAVTSNPGPMALWAALIVAITVVGVATLFVGLAVFFPILGYATWHSYRDLVK
jgi:uncharacterized membrane protein